MSAQEISRKVSEPFGLGSLRDIQRSLAVNLPLRAENSGEIDKRIGLGVKTGGIAVSTHAHIQNPVAQVNGR